MRKIGIVSLVLVFLALGLVPRTVSAQANAVKIDIPFAFMVQDTKFPAGTYEIAKVSDRNYLISDQKTHQKVAFMTETTPISAPVASFTLFFNVYGDQYYLSKFFHRAMTSGDMIPQTATEKALAQKGPVTTKTVTVKTK